MGVPSSACEEASSMAAGGRWARVAASAVLVAAGTGGCELTAGGQANAQPTPIQHIVVLYLENHSFDNLLGYWCRNHTGRCPDGGMPSLVRLSNGAVVTPSVTPERVPTIGHNVAAQQAAIDHGLMDGWQHVSGCTVATGFACISGYTPAQVPNLAALASKFAINDLTFSMADSPSWGGHLYAVMASLDGFKGDTPSPARGATPGPGWGCNSDRVTAWISPRGAREIVPSCVPDFSLRLPHG